MVVSKAAPLVVRTLARLDPVLARLAPPFRGPVHHLDLMAAMRKLALVSIRAVAPGLDETGAQLRLVQLGVDRVQLGSGLESAARGARRRGGADQWAGSRGRARVVGLAVHLALAAHERRLLLLLLLLDMHVLVVGLLVAHSSQRRCGWELSHVLLVLVLLLLVKLLLMVLLLMLVLMKPRKLVIHKDRLGAGLVVHLVLVLMKRSHGLGYSLGSSLMVAKQRGHAVAVQMVLVVVVGLLLLLKVVVLLRHEADVSLILKRLVHGRTRRSQWKLLLKLLLGLGLSGLGHGRGV